MYREERAKGVTVQVLDLSALELQALNFRKISRLFKGNHNIDRRIGIEGVDVDKVSAA